MALIQIQISCVRSFKFFVLKKTLAVEENHAIKPLAGIAKEDASRFERALVELQMKMYLTMCGRQQKTSAAGKEYGWSSTVFCTVEDFWGEAVLTQAAKMGREEAIARITAQVLRLNPNAEPEKGKKFIEG